MAFELSPERLEEINAEYRKILYPFLLVDDARRAAGRAGDPEMVYGTTPASLVLQLLDFANATAEDIFYDCGCGLGVPTIVAAHFCKKAIGIEILDVTGKVDYADFLVVMTGRSDRHVHAIATGIEEAMRRRKLAPLSMEGLSAATWVLIDFGEVVVHVFQEEARALYDIEGLWIDASRIPVPADTTPVPASGPSPRLPVD